VVLVATLIWVIIPGFLSLNMKFIIIKSKKIKALTAALNDSTTKLLEAIKKAGG